MIPRIAKRHGSFGLAAHYYVGKAERVGWTHNINLPTSCPHRGFRMMAATAARAEELKRGFGFSLCGRKARKPVHSFSLSWRPDQKPSKEQMIAAGMEALKKLGLSQHETVITCHIDRPHQHIHLTSSTVHPETGKVARLHFSKKKLSAWAHEYELRHGQILCEARAKNHEIRHAARNEREQSDRLRRASVSQMFHDAPTGAELLAKLKEAGYRVAQHNRRIVIVGDDQKPRNLVREIEGIRTKDLREKLRGVSLDIYKEEAQCAKPEPKIQRGRTQDRDAGHSHDEFYFDRDAQQRQSDEAVIDAGIRDHKPEARHSNPRRKASPRRSFDRKPYERVALTGPQASPPSWKINVMMDRQNEEKAALGTERRTEFLKLENRLNDYYGEDEAEQTRQIDELKSKLANANRLQRLWMRVTKQIPKNAELELENMQKNLDQTVSLKKGEIARQETRFDARHYEFYEKHLQEKRELLGVEGAEQARDFEWTRNEYQTPQEPDLSHDGPGQTL